MPTASTTTQTKMIELTEILHAAAPAAARVTLSYEQRVKSRLRVTLDDGREAGLFLPRGSVLKDGDRLAGGDLVVAVVAADEPVSTVSSDDPLLLARACYHLGNRHVPLQIAPGWVRYQHDHVLDDMVRGLGLEVVAGQAPFQPEGGAYGAGGGAHHHHHH